MNAGGNGELELFNTTLMVCKQQLSALNNVKADHNLLKAKYKSLEYQSEQQTEKNNELMNANAQQKEHIDDLICETKMLKGQVDTLRQVNEKMLAESIENKRESRSLLGRISNLESTISQLTKRVRDQDEEIASLTKQKCEYEVNVDDLTSKLMQVQNCKVTEYQSFMQKSLVQENKITEYESKIQALIDAYEKKMSKM